MRKLLFSKFNISDQSAMENCNLGPILIVLETVTQGQLFNYALDHPLLLFVIINIDGLFFEFSHRDFWGLHLSLIFWLSHGKDIFLHLKLGSACLEEALYEGSIWNIVTNEDG